MGEDALQAGCCYLLHVLELGRAGSPELCEHCWRQSLQHHVLHHDLVHLSILHQHHLHHIWQEEKTMRALFSTGRQQRHHGKECPPEHTLDTAAKAKQLKGGT